MRELPIIYSAPMVLAKMAGRKTMTRRTHGLETVNAAPDDWGFDVSGPGMAVANSAQSVFAKFNHRKTGEEIWLRCPYGQPGDVLYSRENLRRIGDVFSYAADGAMWCVAKDYRYRYEEYQGIVPSIHVPKRAARIWDEVVSIRVERVQDITVRDAINEAAPMYVPGHGVVTPEDIQSDPGYRNFIDYKMGFEHLWRSINGDESWNLNPYVWVVTTKNLSTTGKPTSLCMAKE